LHGKEPSPKYDRAPDAPALDRRVLDDAKRGSEIMANLTHLCDVIGPRLTGSANLRRANEWAAAKMREDGLVNVHQEEWTLPEGWQRGPAHARLIEPDNGRTISLASYGWYPGTKGKLQADVIAFDAYTKDEMARYKGKLKGAVVLSGPPSTVLPVEEYNKPLD